jgi:lipoate-protein ligase A
MADWRFLNTGAQDGATNMAIDAAILMSFEEGASPPTLRVYSWAPPTVSIGYSQRPDRELDLERVARAGFGLVRRPTGGRAVLHHGELTYSVVGASGTPPLGGSITSAYRAIAEALLAGLARLGVEAALASVSATPRSRGGVSPPCFASAGRFEIVVGARKLVGSAQRRSEGAVLQHGSLLFDGSHAEIADVLRAASEPERAALRASLAAGTTDLGSILNAAPEFGEVAAALRLGFESAWGKTLSEGRLSDREREVASALATEYSTVC